MQYRTIASVFFASREAGCDPWILPLMFYIMVGVGLECGALPGAVESLA